MRGPGFRALDLSLFTTFTVAGRTNLELRFESFNVFNRTQFFQPGQVLGSPDFGRTTSTRLNTERQVQIAARLTF